MQKLTNDFFLGNLPDLSVPIMHLYRSLVVKSSYSVNLFAALDFKMSVPDYYRNVSLVLSRVMNDIGVNEECVMRRRRLKVLSETCLLIN